MSKSRETTVDDVVAFVVPAGIDPLTDRVFLASLQPLVETCVWGQFEGFRPPAAIRFETVTWLVTREAWEVEAFQPAHDCARCRAANDQMLAFLRDNPTRWVALGNMRYVEVWR